MQFLNPAILLGLAAAAVPLVLHFLSRRRVTEIEFAPLRFLLATQERQMRRMSLRRLLLLLLRMAIVVLVVLAVARPMLRAGLPGISAGGEGASVVLLIDDSASMQAELTGGRVFDLARDEAAEIVSALDSSDEMAVLGFGASAHPLFSEFIGNADLVRSSIAEMECTAESSDYLVGLDAAREFLSRGTRARREIYLIGDFQKMKIDSLEIARWQAGQVGAELMEAKIVMVRLVGDIRRPIETPCRLRQAVGLVAIGLRGLAVIAEPIAAIEQHHEFQGIGPTGRLER